MSVTRNRSTPRGDSFWADVEKAAADVSEWPAWKRGECEGKEAPMAFHLRDGLYFERADSGSVVITKRHPVTGAEEWMVTATRDGWASVVARVSHAGEDAETYAAALGLHDGAAE